MFLTSGEELHEATREAGMSQFHSDALVLFGAKGDLAFKKIFPALHAMVKRGRLNVPVIAVARGDWNHEVLASLLKNHSAGTSHQHKNSTAHCIRYSRSLRFFGLTTTSVSGR